MRFDDLIRISLRQVVRYHRRYWGVVLAIALGVAAFITMVTMGQEVKKTFNKDLELIGGATIIRSYFDNYPTMDNYKGLRPNWFHPATLAGLRQVPGVLEVSPVAMRWTYGNWRRERYSFQLLAVDETFWQVRSLWALTGRLFGFSEVLERKRELVLGARLAQRIFGHLEVAGEILEIEQDLFQVVGVVGGATDLDLAHGAFIPLTTFEDRIIGSQHPDRLYVRCVTWDDVEQVAQAIPAVVQAHQPSEQLRVEVSWRALKQVKKVSWWIESFIFLSIFATLGLGGFGIWNVMMAAVRSRTREIGLKKAMGAEDRDILAQFITESLCLSVGAAVMGFGLGRFLVEIISFWLGTRPSEEVFFSSLGMGLLFAIILGIGAGLYPSLQASRMDVVSATRYE